jgi:hypothetical protein
LSTEASSPNPAGGAPLITRDILGRAWPLFKACLPVCLPLAVIGVAAGATPGAESAMSAEGHGYAHGREWWGLLFASTLLTLICYGAVLRQQVAWAQGERALVLDSMRRAVADLPFVLPLLVLLALPLVPAMVATALRGFDLFAALLTLAGMALLVYALIAWPALVAGRLSPFAALGLSIRTVHGRWRQFASLALMLLSAILVFVLLSGILIGVVMGLAGQATPTAGGLALSRWLMALILAVPVVYAGAVTVTTWRVVTAAPASPGGAVPPPAA